MKDTLRLGKLAKTNAQKKAGSGWVLLGADIQEALVMREAAYIVLAQELKSYGPAQEILTAAFAAVSPEGR